MGIEIISLPDELCDESLNDRFLHKREGSSSKDPIKGEGGVEDAMILKPRVLYSFSKPATGKDEPFRAWSPQPTHIVVAKDGLDGVHQDSLHNCLSKHVQHFEIYLHNITQLQELCKVLGSLPRESPLRTLSLVSADDFLPLQHELRDTLSNIPYHIQNLEVRWIGGQTLTLNLLQVLELLEQLELLAVTKWATKSPRSLRLELPRMPRFRLNLSIFTHFESIDLILPVQFPIYRLQALTSSSHMRRLEFSGIASLSEDGMKVLLGCVASPSCGIQALGFNLSGIHESKDVQMSMLVHAFQSSSAMLNKIKALYFKGVNSHKAVGCVLDILVCPATQCQVRILCVDGKRPFIRLFCDGLFKHRVLNIERLTIITSAGYVKFGEGLRDFLKWEGCPLVLLECICGRSDVQVEDTDGDNIAAALESNYQLAYLNFPFQNLEARSRAMLLLARNRLYKSIGVSRPDQERHIFKAQQLFLCGHPRAGKTSLHRALVECNRGDQRRPTVPYCSFFDRLRPEARRRRAGRMVIHDQLHFQEGRLVIPITTLGGRRNCHRAFFSRAPVSRHLFIVVSCKYESDSDDANVLSRFHYWLRFIVSHRRSVQSGQLKPKILLVLNDCSGSMQTALDSFTETQRSKYGEELYFGRSTCVSRVDTHQVKPILEALEEELLQDPAQSAIMIPKLCHDLLSPTSPLQVAAQQSRTKRGRHKQPLNYIVAFDRDLRDAYVQQLRREQGGADEPSDIIPADRCWSPDIQLQAALVHLHNVGEVIFFPAADIFITEPSRLYHEVVGALLAQATLSSQRFEMNEVEVRIAIRRMGIPNDWVSQILRYIQSLELCFAIADKFVFPALLAADTEWMDYVNLSLSSVAESLRGLGKYIGRRIKCKDTQKHLIPYSVFARLQVKLQQMFCGDSSHPACSCYEMGFLWSEFVTCGVKVRVTCESGLISHNGLSHNPQRLQPNYAPQWIDIFIASNDHVDTQSCSIQSGIMKQIKGLIFDICQSIPTVVLEECALIPHPDSYPDEMALADVHDNIMTVGMARTVPCQRLGDQQGPFNVDLLLPHELEYHMLKHVHAMQQIQAEFADGSTMQYTQQGTQAETGPKGVDKVPTTGEHIGDANLYPQLQGTDKVLHDLVYEEFHRSNEYTKRGNILVLVREIKKDVNKVLHSFEVMAAHVVANCSTYLLTQLGIVAGALPRYPYVACTTGEMKALQEFIRSRKARIHFLCETLEGPHVVEKQEGIDVAVDARILVKMASYLVPTLRVLCCAAKFALHPDLPGIAPPCFKPLVHFLKCIGITRFKNIESMQAKDIMADALDTLFDELHAGLHHLLEDRQSEEQRKAAMDGIQSVLGAVDHLDMANHFGLQLYQSSNRSLMAMYEACTQGWANTLATCF